MSSTEPRGEEDYAILDEGAGRPQEPLSQQAVKPASKKPVVGSRPVETPYPVPRVGVYPLDAGEAAAASSRPSYPADAPINRPLNNAQAPLNPPRQAPAAEVSRAAPGDAGSWMIQAGSFTGEANARNLVEKLRKSNFPAFVEVIPSESGVTMYRVRIGPESSKAHAEQVRARVESTVGIKGMIVPR